MLQDGATALRQARQEWALGQTPLPPSSMPSFEVGLGGAGSDGVYTPLTGGEGLGHGTEGWGLGLQGRYSREGWSISATALAFRDHGATLGILQRAALGLQSESGWRVALEQAPFVWGAGLNGGELLGDAARAFPRLSLATPAITLPLGRWQLEVFLGRLAQDGPLPAWIPDRESRATAAAAGLGLHQSRLWGALARAAFGSQLEGSLGAITITSGQDELGRPAPVHSARTQSLAELRLRTSFLAELFHARGASWYLSRSGAPDDGARTLVPARDLGGLQLIWEGWDLTVEYAGSAAQSEPMAWPQPAYLAGFSNHGDPLGSAFGRASITRTVALGLPLFLEGQGRLELLRATSAYSQETGTASWFLQGDAQWRTPTGRLGASLSTRRNDEPGSEARWGWAFSLFQAFRVF